MEADRLVEREHVLQERVPAVEILEMGTRQTSRQVAESNMQGGRHTTPLTVLQLSKCSGPETRDAAPAHGKQQQKRKWLNDLQQSQINSSKSHSWKC